MMWAVKELLSLIKLITDKEPTNVVEWRPGLTARDGVVYIVAAQHQFAAQDAIPGDFFVSRMLIG